MAKLCSVFRSTAVVCLMVGAVGAADRITWDEPRNIAGDTDVVNVGRLCYAYTKGDNAVTVNGVPFARANNSNIAWNNYPLNDPYWNLGEANTALTGYIGGDYFYPAGTLRPEEISDDYRKLLGLRVYGGASDSIKLRNFIVGHTYLVQIWSSNARAGEASTWCNYYMSLDGQVELCQHPTGAPAGQYAIGRFTATGNDVTIEFGPTALVGMSSGAGYNAIQVRDVTPTVIDWAEPVTSYDDNDVRTDGELVFAFNGSNTRSHTVNGVEFQAAGNNCLNILQIVGFASIPAGHGFMSYDPPTNERVNRFATYPASASDAYKAMLGNFMYVSGSGSNEAIGKWWFTGLVPGERYLVQLWFNKAQNATWDRYLKVDCVRNVEGRVESADNRGQYIVGEFTAYAATQEFFLRGASHAQSTTDNVSASFSAIQLRHLPPAGKVAFSSGWTDVRYAQNATDVSTNGTIVGAYFANATAQTLTVNGVPFVSQQSTSNWGDGRVLLKGFPHGLASKLMNNYTGPELGDYKALLNTAVFSWYYSDGDPAFKNKNPVNAELTITGLEPNTRYEVQAWVNDNTPPSYKSGSTGYGGDWRLATFGSIGQYPYRSPESPYLGPIGRARIIVEPGVTTYKLPISYTTHPDINVNEVRAYLNALQIRKADSIFDPQDANASKVVPWTGYGVPWNTAAGRDRMALLENGGTMELMGNASVGVVKSLGALTICGTGALDLADEIFAPSCMVSALFAGESIVKTQPGSLVITGAAPKVNKILLRAGSLDFSPSVAPTEGVFLSMLAGTQLAFGTDLKVARWDVQGAATITRKDNAVLRVKAGDTLSNLTIAVAGLTADYKQYPILSVEGGSLSAEPVFDVTVPGMKLVVEKRSDGNGNDAYYLKPNGYMSIIVR